eukprot:scaffold436_cov336-Pavlova_lutheri.AAC.12
MDVHAPMRRPWGPWPILCGVGRKGSEREGTVFDGRDGRERDVRRMVGSLVEDGREGGRIDRGSWGRSAGRAPRSFEDRDVGNEGGGWDPSRTPDPPRKGGHSSSPSACEVTVDGCPPFRRPRRIGSDPPEFPSPSEPPIRSLRSIHGPFNRIPRSTNGPSPRGRRARHVRWDPYPAPPPGAREEEIRLTRRPPHRHRPLRAVSFPRSIPSGRLPGSLQDASVALGGRLTPRSSPCAWRIVPSPLTILCGVRRDGRAGRGAGDGAHSLPHVAARWFRARVDRKRRRPFANRREQKDVEDETRASDGLWNAETKRTRSGESEREGRGRTVGRGAASERSLSACAGACAGSTQSMAFGILQHSPHSSPSNALLAGNKPATSTMSSPSFLQLRRRTKHEVCDALLRRLREQMSPALEDPVRDVYMKRRRCERERDDTKRTGTWTDADRTRGRLHDTGLRTDAAQPLCLLANTICS